MNEVLKLALAYLFFGTGVGVGMGTLYIGWSVVDRIRFRRRHRDDFPAAKVHSR